jgi:hypothetical protein
VLLALALIAGDAPRAEACSPPSNGFIGVRPWDGEIDVPTNVLIRVHQRSSPDGLLANDVILLDAAGSRIEVVKGYLPEDIVTMSPVTPLSPESVYEIRGRFIPYCTSGECVSDEPVHYASFRTGAGGDLTSPVFAGLQTIEYGSWHECDSSACCGPYLARYFQLVVPDATDDSGVVGLNVYWNGQLLLASGGLFGAYLCDASGWGVHTLADFIAGTGSIRVTAVDLAGNEDGNATELELAVDCSSAPDAGLGTDGGAGADGGGSGCSVAGRRGASSGWWLVAILILGGWGPWPEARCPLARVAKIQPH